MSAPGIAPEWRLRDADARLRAFLVLFLLTLTAGYAIGILFVDHSSGGTPQGIAEQFRGSGEAAPSAEIRYEKSPDEMYVFLHNHVLSLSLVFFAVGGIFYFSSIARGGLKTFLMVEPLAAVATTFGGIWLMRFVSPAFSYLVLLSGVTMMLCYLAMVGLMLVELLSGRKR
jgi:hypothetical protein